MLADDLRRRAHEWASLLPPRRGFRPRSPIPCSCGRSPHDKYRRLLWQRGIKPVIARRQTEHGSGLGRQRWVVERTFAWLHNRRRLLIRTDRHDDIHEGFLALACCLICWRRRESLRPPAVPGAASVVSAVLSETEPQRRAAAAYGEGKRDASRVRAQEEPSRVAIPGAW